MPHKNEIERKAYKHRYYELHKEEARQRNAAYRASHHVEISEKKRAYQQAHREEIIAYLKQWRHDHPNYGTQYHRKWRADNPRKQAAAVERQLKRKKQARIDNPEVARAKGRMYGLRHRALGKITPDDIAAIIKRDNWRCCICGRRVSQSKISIDHIVPVSFGGTNELSNLRLTHWKCNQHRGNVGPAQIILN